MTLNIGGAKIDSLPTAAHSPLLDRTENRKSRIRSLAADTIAMTMFIVPLLSAIEILLRGRHAVLLIKDILVEGLTLLCLLPPLIALIVMRENFPVRLLVTLGMLGVLLLVLRAASKRRKLLVKKAFGILRAAAYLFVGITGCAFWWYLSSWKNSFMALACLLLLPAYLVMIQRRYEPRCRIGFICGAASIAAFFVINGVAYWSAAIEPSRTIFGRQAYDALVLPDKTLVNSLDDRKTMIERDGRWQPVLKTWAPQRFAFDEGSGAVYIANFSHDESTPAVSVLARDGGISGISEPQCRKTIDVKVDAARNRLFLGCEFSGRLAVIDLAGRMPARLYRVPRLPYHIEIDGLRNRVYLTNHFFSARITEFDGDDFREKAKFLGFMSWGAAVEPESGNVWVARPIAGEILVFDQSLGVIDRIKVGNCPRELVIDRTRGVVLSGNYFDGTVTVIDLATRRVRETLRVGNYHPLPRLRGISVGADGDWYASWFGGVVKIEPHSL